MISTFMFMFCFFVASIHCCNQSNTTRRNRRKAQSNGDIYYWDGENRRRSTDTNEILTYFDNKLIGVKTGILYIDYTQKMVDEKNHKMELCGSPVYFGRCKEYWDGKKMTHYHLRERDTNEMYHIISNCVRRDYNNDFNYFVIGYLDEDHNITGRTKVIPKSLLKYYKGLYDA